MAHPPAKKRSRKAAPIPALSTSAIGAASTAASPWPATATNPTSPALPLRSPPWSEMRGKLDRVLSRFVPAHVVIDSNHEVVQFQGNAGRYLELAPGGANLNLFTMVRQGLLGPLRTTLRAANERRASARARNVAVKTNGGLERINIEVTPLQVGVKKTWFVVVFEATDENVPLPQRPGLAEGPAPGTRARSGSEIVRLREELAQLRESLRMAVIQQEQTNGELFSANEEVQSANEELQSINEELETSREQLQSSNDQLLTVNESLLERSVELSALNSELKGLLECLDIAVVVIDTNMRIKSFTAAAEGTFKLIPGDVGRPLHDLNLSVVCPELEAHLQEVMKSGRSKRLEAQDRNGSSYSVRLNPYFTEEKKLDGVAIVTVDIN